MVATAIGITTNGTPYDWLESEANVSPGSAPAQYQAVDDEDGDNDGMRTAEEYVAGTDPDVASSVFLAAMEPLDRDRVRLRWPSSPGRQYTILASANAHGPFVFFSGPHEATEPINEHIISITHGVHGAFKIAVERD